MVYRLRKKIIKIMLHVFGVLLFVLATSYALLAAYGYQIDLLHRNIVKTSIIDINGDYPLASLYVNDSKVSKKLPFQVKNIEPGTYTVTVKKEDFFDWRRKVEVFEDVATIVDDVYLVPKIIDKYIDHLLIQFEYDEVFAIRDTVFFVDLVQNNIYRANMTFDEPVFNEIEISEDIVYNKVYPLGGGHIAFESEDRVYLYNIDTEIFFEIFIPNEFTQFNLFYDSSLKGIYENKGALFIADISDKGVFQEIKLLKKLDEDVALKVQSADTHVLVMLGNDLYKYSRDNLLIIDSEVAELPHVSPRGDLLLYKKTNREVHVYFFETLRSKLIARFSDKIDCIKWSFTGNHFFLLINDSLYLCDMKMDNCKALLSQKDIRNLYVMKTKPLLVVTTGEGIERVDLKFD